MFDIKELAQTLGKDEWKSTIILIEKYNLKKPFWFTLLTTEKFFSQKIIPDNYKLEIDKKVLFLSLLYPLEAIQITTKRTGIKGNFVQIYAYLLSGLTQI